VFREIFSRASSFHECLQAICDVYMRHPSLSKQHAVLQYRGRSFADPKLPHAPPTLQVLPYLMDLGSTNGTFLNGERIEAQR
jgi:pSer/pThr/pTyr-binding forkhead associated (FHA) protein